MPVENQWTGSRPRYRFAISEMQIHSMRKRLQSTNPKNVHRPNDIDSDSLTQETSGILRTSALTEHGRSPPKVFNVMIQIRSLKCENLNRTQQYIFIFVPPPTECKFKSAHDSPPLYDRSMRPSDFAPRPNYCGSTPTTTRCLSSNHLSLCQEIRRQTPPSNNILIHSNVPERISPALLRFRHAATLFCNAQ